MNRYKFRSVTSMSGEVTPYSCMRIVNFWRTVVVLRMREARMRSISQTAVRPSLSSARQSQDETSSKDYLPMFCKLYALISNSFYNFQNLFYVNLLYTRARYISLVARTITYTTERTASSMPLCSSTSLPLSPCRITTAKRYFKAPKSMSSSMMAVSCSGVAAVNDPAMTLSAGREKVFLPLSSCSMISLPFMEWKTDRDAARLSAGFVIRMARQSNRLERYSCSSLLEGLRERYGLMDYMSISTPQSLWNLSCAGTEWESNRARTSLLTNLLSSMTLCAT